MTCANFQELEAGLGAANQLTFSPIDFPFSKDEDLRLDIFNYQDQAWVNVPIDTGATINVGGAGDVFYSWEVFDDNGQRAVRTVLATATTPWTILSSTPVSFRPRICTPAAKLVSTHLVGHAILARCGQEALMGNRWHATSHHIFSTGILKPGGLKTGNAPIQRKTLLRNKEECKKKEKYLHGGEKYASKGPRSRAAGGL